MGGKQNFDTYGNTILSAINETGEGKENYKKGIKSKIKNLNGEIKILNRLKTKIEKNTKIELSEIEKKILNIDFDSTLEYYTDGGINKIKETIIQKKGFLEKLKDLKKDIEVGLKEGIFKEFRINNLDHTYFSEFSISKNIKMSYSKTPKNKNNFNEKFKEKFGENFDIQNYLYIETNDNFSFNLTIVDGIVYELNINKSGKLLSLNKSEKIKLEGLQIIYGNGKTIKQKVDKKINKPTEVNISKEKEEEKEKIISDDEIQDMADYLNNPEQAKKIRLDIIKYGGKKIARNIIEMTKKYIKNSDKNINNLSDEKLKKLGENFKNLSMEEKKKSLLSLLLEPALDLYTKIEENKIFDDYEDRDFLIKELNIIQEEIKNAILNPTLDNKKDNKTKKIEK